MNKIKKILLTLIICIGTANGVQANRNLFQWFGDEVIQKGKNNIKTWWKNLNSSKSDKEPQKENNANCLIIEKKPVKKNFNAKQPVVKKPTVIEEKPPKTYGGYATKYETYDLTKEEGKIDTEQFETAPLQEKGDGTFTMQAVVETSDDKFESPPKKKKKAKGKFEKKVRPNDGKLDDIANYIIDETDQLVIVKPAITPKGEEAPFELIEIAMTAKRAIYRIANKICQKHNILSKKKKIKNEIQKKIFLKINGKFNSICIDKKKEFQKTQNCVDVIQARLDGESIFENNTEKRKFFKTYLEKPFLRNLTGDNVQKNRNKEIYEQINYKVNQLMNLDEENLYDELKISTKMLVAIENIRSNRTTHNRINKIANYYKFIKEKLPQELLSSTNSKTTLEDYENKLTEKLIQSIKGTKKIGPKLNTNNIIISNLNHMFNSIEEDIAKDSRNYQQCIEEIQKIKIDFLYQKFKERCKPFYSDKQKCDAYQYAVNYIENNNSFNKEIKQSSLIILADTKQKIENTLKRKYVYKHLSEFPRIFLDKPECQFIYELKHTKKAFDKYKEESHKLALKTLIPDAKDLLKKASKACENIYTKNTAKSNLFQKIHYFMKGKSTDHFSRNRGFIEKTIVRKRANKHKTELQKKYSLIILGKLIREYKSIAKNLLPQKEFINEIITANLTDAEKQNFIQTRFFQRIKNKINNEIIKKIKSGAIETVDAAIEELKSELKKELSKIVDKNNKYHKQQSKETTENRQNQKWFTKLDLRRYLYGRRLPKISQYALKLNNDLLKWLGDKPQKTLLYCKSKYIMESLTRTLEKIFSQNQTSMEPEIFSIKSFNELQEGASNLTKILKENDKIIEYIRIYSTFRSKWLIETNACKNKLEEIEKQLDKIKNFTNANKETLKKKEILLNKMLGYDHPEKELESTRIRNTMHTLGYIHNITTNAMGKIEKVEDIIKKIKNDMVNVSDSMTSDETPEEHNTEEIKGDSLAIVLKTLEKIRNKATIIADNGNPQKYEAQEIKELTRIILVIEKQALALKEEATQNYIEKNSDLLSIWRNLKATLEHIAEQINKLILKKLLNDLTKLLIEYSLDQDYNIKKDTTNETIEGDLGKVQKILKYIKDSATKIAADEDPQEDLTSKAEKLDNITETFYQIVISLKEKIVITKKKILIGEKIPSIENYFDTNRDCRDELSQTYKHLKNCSAKVKKIVRMRCEEQKEDCENYSDVWLKSCDTSAEDEARKQAREQAREQAQKKDGLEIRRKVYKKMRKWRNKNGIPTDDETFTTAVFKSLFYDLKIFLKKKNKA